MPSLADLEQWIEEQIPQEIHDLPFKIQSILQTYQTQLVEQMDQIVRLGPSLAREIESNLPSNPFKSTNDLSSIPQSNPSNSSFSFIEHVAKRIDTYTGSRRRTSIVSGIAFVGLTYAIIKQTQSIQERNRISFENDPEIPPRIRNGNRIDAVILLGVEGQFGQSLAHSFTSRGFIVLASVSSEDEKLSFDALVPPSMRGYIKTIVLPNTETRPEHISNFIRTISTAQQLRWPLTAAGDPYARQGREINVVAIVNASSYISPFESAQIPSSLENKSSSSSSTFEVQTLSNELQKRVITPLAVTQALLHSIKPSQRQDLSSNTKSHKDHIVVLSLIRPKGESDIISQSVKAGTHALLLEEASRRNVSCLVLEAREPSIRNLFLSIWPRILGSNAISTDYESSHKQSWSNDLKSSQTSIQIKKIRHEENRMVGEATISILRKTFADQGKVWHKTFFVRLKNIAYQPSQTHDRSPQWESTIFLRVFQTVINPVMFSVTTLYNRIGLPVLRRILPPYNRRDGICYSGTSNPSNSKPAFGYGPGPASNTHSRSCIRPNETGKSSNLKSTDSLKQQQQKRQRPFSTVSNASSSDHARSSESETGSGGGLSSGSGSNEAKGSNATGSAPVSAPPSTHDMSSSGLLSSVPSSAFGDEDGTDSDYLHTNESPILTHHNTEEDGGFDASHLRASSSSSSQDGSWHHTSYQNSQSQLREEVEHLNENDENQISYSQSSSSILSDDQADDSGTALGVRTNATNTTEPQQDQDKTSKTPSASHFEEQPSQQSRSATGTQSPLGQSWVALGQSQTEDQQTR